MKKIVLILGCIILSSILTFTIFEMMSWYHFGDIPTKIVTIRLIITFGFFSIFTTIIATYQCSKKVKNNKKCEHK